MGKSDRIAAEEIYKVAQQRANAKLEKMTNEMDAVRDESKALGVLQKIDYDLAHNEMLKYAVLYQVKQDKEYKKGGMTWAEFCEEIGEQKRNADRILKDMKPVYDHFLDKMSNLLGFGLSKIRYLGRSKLDKMSNFEDGCLIFEGAKIPITPENAEEIEAAIDEMKKSRQIETDGLLKEVNKLTKNVDKIVKEETKTLEAERDALVEQNERLKVFDPADKDHEWSVDQMKMVQKTALEFTAACRRMKMDERIADDMHIQGKVEGLMAMVDKNFRMLRNEWDEKFALFEG